MESKPSRTALFAGLLCIIFSSVVWAAVQDPISTAATTFEDAGQAHPITFPNKFWGSNYQKPLPTNAWWTNLVIENSFNPIKTYPYTVFCAADGFHVCYPGRVTASAYTLEAFVDNIIMGAKESLGTRQVVNNDDLTVTVQYSDGTNYMSSPIVRGQAYHTVVYNNLTPVLKTIHGVTGVNGGSASGSWTTNKLKLAFNNGQTWLIYSSNTITWTLSGTTLTAGAKYTGVIRAAMMMSSNQEALYDEHSDTYPVSGKVTYSASGNTMTMKYTFGKQGGTESLLLFALPHHQDILQNPTYATPELKYRSIKGYMLGIVADEWTMKDQLVSDIGFMSRYTIPTSNVAALKAQLAKDQNAYPSNKDPYFGGKEIAKLGRLAVIADELGETAIASKIRSNMKTWIQKWFNVGWTSSDNKFVYERTYGGIVTKGSVGSSGADYGQYYYNDHHFHFGYFIFGAACIIKKDVAWGEQYKTKILELVRDIANPSDLDPSFTKTRNKDWFVGHSYAAGLFAFGDSRNQESTSEAINAYYGVYTLGLAFNDANLRDLGRIMLQTEIRSTQKYWQITSNSGIYDAPFSNNKAVGVLWETKVDYATFFGLNVEYIHGIQMLPFTPITEDYLTANWISESYPIFSAAYSRTSPVAEAGWLGLMYQAQAVIDKQGAAARIATLTGVDNGNSMTNTLYWLYTRPDSTNSKRSNPFADIDALENVTPIPSPSTSSGSNPIPSPSPVPESSNVVDPLPSSPTDSECPTCGEYTKLCGSVCYNTDRFDCCDSVVKSKGSCTENNESTACATVKCGSGYQCCNGACYLPSIYTCSNNKLCPVGTQNCGSACYSPSIYQCCNGTTLKPLSLTC